LDRAGRELEKFNRLSASIYASPSNSSPRKQTQKSPPKVNLSSLLASPTSTSTSLSTSSPRRFDSTTIRAPRGPEHDLDLGFSSGKKIERYDHEEEARDEVNLGIPDTLLLEGLDKGLVEAVANPDKIVLESEDEV